MLVRTDYWKRVVAGGTFGLYVAELLYLLNPQISVEPLRFVRDLLVYFVICALIFGNLFWLLHRLRERFLWPSDPAERTHGFGYFVVVAFFSAAVYWGHLTVLRIYLPRGAIRILSKATLLLGALAILLLLIWLIERNASRGLSRTLSAFALLLVLSFVVVTYQRRDSYEAARSREPAVRITPRPPIQRTMVVLVRQLPFDWIVTIAGESGEQLFGNRSLDSGDPFNAYFTRIEPFRTSSPRSLSASLATGQLPARHGVTGRFSYRTLLNREGERWLLLPRGVGFRTWGLLPPVDRIAAALPSGEALPFWMIFHRLGAEARVDNWPFAGVSVAPGLRVRGGEDRFNGVPLQRTLALDLERVRAAGSSGEDLVVVSLDGIHRIARSGAIDTNRLPADSTDAGQMIRRHVRRIDSLLDSIVAANPDRLVIALSASGPAPPELPTNAQSIVRAIAGRGNAGEGDGFLYLAGRGVRSGEGVRSTQSIDLVPTLLYASGYPIARDLDGRIVIEAFDEQHLRERPLTIVQSFEGISVRR